MTGQGGEALELALGLLRAPALRSALRRRPLPAGIGEVLAIASESSEATCAASARTGVAAAGLVEASRFYIQQILLADDADAYRNLGATPDAEHAVLRDHHRLLLRWLHPDRSREGAQWDSALSTRVNQAWNQLRTPVVRARYDAERAAAEAPGAAPGP
ncbi:MAG TPA: DnaJ domain-containing protein, partial [Luteimonas sp.]